MKKYTKEEILMAAKIGEVSMIDANHIVGILNESNYEEDTFNISIFSHLKEYISDRQIAIDKEIDRKSTSDNPFVAAYYNGVKIELRAVEMLIDALIEKQNVLSKIGAVS